jgi:hypothetical protein
MLFKMVKHLKFLNFLKHIYIYILKKYTYIHNHKVHPREIFVFFRVCRLNVEKPLYEVKINSSYLVETYRLVNCVQIKDGHKQIKCGIPYN